MNSDGGLVTRLRLSRPWRAVVELAQPWTAGVRTRIRPERFDHITTGGTNR